MAGLLDTIKDKAKQVYSQGLLNQVITNPASVGQELSQIFDPSYMSQVRPMSQQTALDVALSAPMMPLTFIGKGSKLWNPKNEQLFAQLEKKGLSPEEIWKQTGTLRGVDGKLRQEISDKAAKVIPVENKDITYSLPKVLSHEQLYKSYPDLETTMMGFKKTTGQSSAYYPDMDMIKLGEMKAAYKNEAQYNKELNKIYKMADNLDKKGLLTPEKDAELSKMADDLANKWFDNASVVYMAEKSPLLHEIQHAVQKQEGFGKGGNVSEFLDYGFSNGLKNVDDAKLDAYKQYQRLLGEAEARMTESRMNLTPKQRLEYFPYNQGKYGLDVPYNELIVRGLLD